MIYNPYIFIPLVSWLLAQLIKFLIRAFKGKIDWRLMYVSGGMPSAHAAVVASLAAVALVFDGARSPLFGITAVLAGVVMYDALGVRRMAGEQAMAFNKLMASLSQSRLGPPDLPALRELKGHRPSEVLAGAALGIAMAVVASTSRLKHQFLWLGSAPTHLEVLIMTAVFGLLVVAGWIGLIAAKTKYRYSVAVRKAAKGWLIATQVTGALGLVLAFAEAQKAVALEARAWSYILAAATISWVAILIGKYRHALPRALAGEAERTRKERWLKKPKA